MLSNEFSNLLPITLMSSCASLGHKQMIVYRLLMLLNSTDLQKYNITYRLLVYVIRAVYLCIRAKKKLT